MAERFKCKINDLFVFVDGRERDKTKKNENKDYNQHRWSWVNKNSTQKRPINTNCSKSSKKLFHLDRSSQPELVVNNFRAMSEINRKKNNTQNEWMCIKQRMRVDEYFSLYSSTWESVVRTCGGFLPPSVLSRIQNQVTYGLLIECMYLCMHQAKGSIPWRAWHGRDKKTARGNFRGERKSEELYFQLKDERERGKNTQNRILHLFIHRAMASSVLFSVEFERYQRKFFITHIGMTKEAMNLMQCSNVHSIFLAFSRIFRYETQDLMLLNKIEAFLIPHFIGWWKAQHQQSERKRERERKCTEHQLYEPTRK